MSDDRRLREAAQAVVDLVFTDDMELFDSLPDEIQANLGPALSAIGDPMTSATDTGRLVFVLTIAAEIAAECRSAFPAVLNHEIDDMVSERDIYQARAGGCSRSRDSTMR